MPQSYIAVLTALSVSVSTIPAPSHEDAAGGSGGGDPYVPHVECPDASQPRACFFVGLKRGEPAPIDGDLFSTDLIVDMMVKAESCNERIELEMTTTATLARARCTLEKALLKGERDRYRAELKAMQPSWISRPIVVATVSVIATFGALLIAASVVKQAE